MPLYEYQCKKCRHRFERIRKFSDPPLKRCPECGGTVEQLLSAPAVQFKGSGWYVTDYARAGSKSNASEADRAQSGEAKAETKAETTAETKTEKSESKPAEEKSKSEPKKQHSKK